MVTSIFADVTPYLQALAAGNEGEATRELIDLLGRQRVPADKLAGRIGLAALWGGAEPHAVSAMAATGSFAEWMRGIPAGPEPGEDLRRVLGVVVPISQGASVVAGAIGAGMEPHDEKLPEPLFPAQVKHPNGPIAALRDAFAARDVTGAQRILLGYHATGADYRALLATLYAALAHRYPEGGHPLIFTRAASRILDLGDWGGNMPAFIAWLTPLLCAGEIDALVSSGASAYAASYDFTWLRKRLASAKEEAAGQAFQRAVVTGDDKAACDAVVAALQGGATARGVAAAMAHVAADQLVAVPAGDRDGLLKAAHQLQYQHAVATALGETQEMHVWPILFTAACALRAANVAGAASPRAAATSAGTGAGTMGMAQLRTLDQQLMAGDAAGALGTAHRYLQMVGAPRALAGVIASVAARTDLKGASLDSLHLMPAVEAALDSWVRLPQAISRGGMNSLLSAAIRLTTELRGEGSLAQRVRGAIDLASAQTA